MYDFYQPMPYTEQQIRGLAINFLRFHYKLRPRYGGSGTRVVDKPHYYQGVLIDARLAYRKPDRTYFTATVEATSVDRQHEILYQANYWRIGWHTLVLTLFVAALLVWAGLPPLSGLLGAGAPEPRFNLWRAFGSPGVYGFLLLALLAIAATIFAFLRRLRTYRYIYAVDQFKHFFADAQWVAYDVEIFQPDNWRSRRKYRELERQCVKYGFGLLAVEADKVVKNVISPSQVDQFRGHRIRLPRWLARAEETQPADPGTLPPEVVDPLALESPEVVVLPPRPGRPKFYEEPRRRGALWRARARRVYRKLFPSALRSRPGYYKLGWWVLILGLPSLVLLGYGLYRQAAYSPLATAGGKFAAPDLAPLESENDPVPFIDPEVGEYHRTIEPDPGEAAERNVPEEALVAPERIEDLMSLRRYRLSADGQEILDYDCLPLYQLEESVFILLFGRYASFASAREWALELNRLYGSPVTVAAGDCVEADGSGYLLYIDTPTSDEGAANYLARTFIRETGLDVEIIEIN
ncbi:hypothetical protein CLV84_1302 [Neolewinella xylanilytica]|uniref:Uncharacterized protein n=1 Tax=Neolewinella xylanilytica TaxID=1514080 RepID=A0A2S6IA21_9BACT|nr:hypothetical protein [Neolewinella xylanilytica]PPK88336.1 hypothetical protein CLV84_1302 [Neolewinella xylanilytica]